MASWLAVALLLPAVVVAIVDWRKGLFAMIIVALLQDPARKLETNQPVYFVVLVGVVFAVVFLRAWAAAPFAASRIAGWKRFLGAPLTVFGVLLVFQAAHSLAAFGNLMFVAIGALSYLAPFPAVLLGYRYAERTGVPGIRRWFKGYLVGVMLVLLSVVLEYSGVEWRTLGEVGEGLGKLYTETSVLIAHSGFFRASETAAWHTAAAVCLLILVSTTRKLSLPQIAIVVLIIFALLAIGALTGRRKMFVEIVIFIATYMALLVRFGKGGLKLSAAIFVGGLLVYVLAMVTTMDEPANRPAMTAGSYQGYLERGAGVRNYVADRANMGFEPVLWAINGFGWLGGGLGVASQGAQHFGGGADLYGGAGEGGLGKVTAEMGVPGLLVVLWLAVAGVRYGWQILVHVSRRSVIVARLTYGLVAFLIANLAVFMVATQVFGDLFVLLLLGMVAGFFMATPVLAERERAQVAAGRQPLPRAMPSVVGEHSAAHAARRS